MERDGKLNYAHLSGEALVASGRLAWWSYMALVLYRFNCRPFP